MMDNMASQISILLLAVVICLFSAAEAQDSLSVDTGECAWYGGDYGDDTNCPGDSVIFGSCGSGSDPDCDSGDYYDMILCCELDVSTTFEIDSSSCEDYYGEFGERVSCPGETNGGDTLLSRYLVAGVCGSGRDDDCDGYSHKIRCCQGDFFDGTQLYSGGECYWQFASFGGEIQCLQENEAVFGRCGSGRDPDCEGDVDGNDYYHGIQCCRMAKI